MTLSLSRLLVLVAFVAFVGANLIHNNFTVDPAVFPSAVFIGLMLWKPRRGFLIAAAAFITLPALTFFKTSAILEPTNTLGFLNHIFLLVAGLVGFSAIVVGIISIRQGPMVVD
jgi:hypothetical protein